MDYFKIVNWKKYKHYTNRRPPWIKLYNKLLRKYEFVCLHDDSKLLLLLLWLLASEFDQDDPIIPANDNYLSKQLPIDSEKIKLQPLISAGFIELCEQDDSKVIAN